MLDSDAIRKPVLQSIIQELHLPRGSRGLDAGCGIGLSALLLAVIAIRFGDENLPLLPGGFWSLAVLLAFAGSLFALGMSHEERLSVQKLIRKLIKKPSFGE